MERTEANPTNGRSKDTPLDIEKEKTPVITDNTRLCSCSHNLGVHQLTDRDISNAEEFQRKHNLSLQAVNFIRAANNRENTTMQAKINELKENLAEYSFDNTKIISLPNQVPLPEKPALLDVHLGEKRGGFKAYHIEDVLHHQITNALHNISKDTDACVVKGFNSKNCFYEKLAEAELLRKKLQKGDKKKKLNPEKFPPLNKHEEEILEILTDEGENIHSTVAKLIHIHEFFKREKEILEKLLEIIKEKGKEIDDKLSKIQVCLKQNQICLEPEMLTFVLKIVNEDGIKVLDDTPDEKRAIFYRRKLLFSKINDLTVEWDQLIVLKDTRTVINIEVKKGDTLDRLAEASKQTKKRLDILRKVFGYLITSEWKFVKAACLPNLKEYDVNNTLAPCGNCSKFIIDSEQLEDLKPWMEIFLQNKSSSEVKKYDNLIAGIIGFMSIQIAAGKSNLIVDPIDYNLKTAEQLVADQNALTGENDTKRKAIDLENDIRTNHPEYSDEQIMKELAEQLNEEQHLSYMLNPRQLHAVMSNSPYLIIEGDFGTGKTFVLKERAKRCAEANKDKNIAFINLTRLLERDTTLCELENISVMDIMAKSDFDQYENIKVISCYDLSKFNNWRTAMSKSGESAEDESTLKFKRVEMCSILESYLRNNKYDFVFIDELYIDKSTEADFFQHCASVCVTLKVFTYTISKGLIKWSSEMKEKYNAEQINLEYNMRNTEKLARVSSFVGKSPDDLSTQISSPQKKTLNINCVTPEKTVAGSDIRYYLNQYQEFDQLSLIEAAIDKYFSRTPTNEPVVILTDIVDGVDFLYTQLKRFLSNSNRNIVYLPNRQWSGLSEQDEHYVNEVEEYLKNPNGFLITDIDSFSGAQARNIIVCTNKMANRDVRNMILRTMSFLILICEEKTEVRNLSCSYGLQKDPDLHNFIRIEPGVCVYSYQNKCKFSSVTLSSAVINKFFHDKPEETIVFLKGTNTERMFQYLCKKFSHQRNVYHFKNNDDIDKQALEREGSVLVVDSIEIFLQNKINNLVLFADNSGINHIRNTRYTRNTIMKAKPKFSLVIHEGAIEAIDNFYRTTPVDDLPSYIHFGSSKPKCYSCIRDGRLPDSILIRMAVKKYLTEILEGSTVILTSSYYFEDIADICVELNDNISELINVHPHYLESGDSNKEHKEVFTEVLQVPGMILVVGENYSTRELTCLDSAQNFIVLANNNNNYDSEFLLKCRNLIAEANPKFAMIIHNENIKCFDPIFEMIPVKITN